MIKRIIDRINKDIIAIQFRSKWRNKNKHNGTYAIKPFDIDCVSIGNATYGGLYVQNDVKSARLTIGSYCSIGDNVCFLLGKEHATNLISTYPFIKRLIDDKTIESKSKGYIIIDDDVWIGYRAMVLSGVHIGQGAVVAAGTVVTKDVPPYAIVGGVPAKVIKYRFSPEVIQQLLKLDYSKLTDDMIREKIDELYTSLDGKSPEEVEKLLDWFPKK